MSEENSVSIENLVFVGLNKRVAALDRRDGRIVWTWKWPSVTKFFSFGGFANRLVTVVYDNEQLFVSINGYQYCLDAATGEQLWFNSMEGFGHGVSSVVTSRSNPDNSAGQHAAAAATEKASMIPPLGSR